MTEDELRAAGWAEDDIPGYLAGRAQAALIVGEIMTAPEPAAPEPAEPRLSVAEQRAVSLAAEVMAQSDGLDKLATARRRAAAETQVTVTRDDAKPSAQERREWALREALQHPQAIIVPGEEPLHDWVLPTPVGVPVNPGEAGRIMITGHGAETVSAPLLPDRLAGNPVAIRTARPPLLEVLTPDNAAEMESRWAHRERLMQNRILAARYGIGQCLAEGIFDAADAAMVKGVHALKLLPGVAGL